MDTRTCVLAALVAAAVALAAGAQPAVPRRVASPLRSPRWAVFAPPAQPSSFPGLANLYTIVNNRVVAPIYLPAFHHNLLTLRAPPPKPSFFDKTSAQSLVKSRPPAFLPQQFIQSPLQYNLFEPYNFPTNRPPPATTEPPSPPTTAATTPTTPTTPAPTTAAPITSTTSLPPSGEGKPTLLLLQPYAKAVAGINGTAVATPVGHAVYRKGQPINVLFDPRAVAVAGPGGHARAHSDLVVSYIEEEAEESNEESD